MNPLIDGYAARLRAGGRAEDTTIRDRVTLLRRLDRELPCGLDEVGTDDLQIWLGRYTGWTLYTYAETVRDFCGWASRAARVPDPAEGLARIRQPEDDPRPATEAELELALANLTGVPLIAVALAAYCGLRCSEIRLLTRRHVTERTVWVQRKGAKTQLLPNHPLPWSLVAPIPPGDPRKPNPVVLTRAGHWFGADHLSKRVSRALDRIGLPHLTLHRFRARYATALAAAGVHATVIQDLMGHSSLVTTQRYIAITDGQRFDAISTLPFPLHSHQEAA